MLLEVICNNILLKAIENNSERKLKVAKNTPGLYKTIEYIFIQQNSISEYLSMPPNC